MSKGKLLKYIVFLMFFIFFANEVALRLYWYYSIWYFDIIMHFLGGFWVALFFLYVFHDKNYSFKYFATIVSYVLLVGILWEFFELFVHNYIGQDPFSYLDTLADICFDLLGGFFAVYYLNRKIMSTVENAVQ